MSTLLYHQANIAISWDDRRWLYVEWIGMQSVDNVHDGCEQMLRLLQVKGGDSVLNDNTRLEGTWIGAAEWVGNEWFPAMIRAGLKRFAWVQSASRFSQVSAEETLKFAPPGVVQLFGSREDAEAWLLWEFSLASKRKTARIILPPQPDRPS
jgi:hypothetical protein